MADKKITQLPNNFPLTGAELIEIVQATDNKKTSLTAIATFIASTLPSSVSANNGLNVVGSTVKMGGNLIDNTIITKIGDQIFKIQGTSASLPTLDISGDTTPAVRTASSDTASVNAITNSMLNDIVPVIRIDRSNSTPGNGIGGSSDYYTTPGIGIIPPGWSQEPDVRLAAVATNANPSFTRACEFQIWTNNANTLNKGLTLDHRRILILHEYGVGNVIDTPTYMLGVDASGNVIENDNVNIAFKVEFESTEVKNGSTKVALTAPGVGKAWIVTDVNAKYTHGSASYDNAKIAIAPSSATPQFTLFPPVLATTTKSIFVTIDKISPLANNSQLVENDSIEITIDPSTTGAGGSITIYGSARLITL